MRKNSPLTISLILTAAFSLLFFVLCFYSAQRKSLVCDEVPHIPGGFMIWKTGDFRINIEHPPLVKIFAALPLLPFNFYVPLKDADWIGGEEWHFGGYFMFYYNDANVMAMLSRFPIMVLGVILGWLVYFWGRHIFVLENDSVAPFAGIFAAALYFTEPNIIAHSSLVTYDLAFALVTFCVGYFYWLLLVRGITIRRLIGFTLCMALAPLVKEIGLFLWVLVYAHLFIVAFFGKRKWRVNIKGARVRLLKRRREKLLSAIIIFILCLAIWYLAVWASYGFRYGISPGHEIPPGPQADEFLHFSNISTPLARKPLEFAQRNRILPQGYLAVLGHAFMERERATYMLGRVKYKGGFLSYFLVTSLLKTPVLHLAVMSMFLGIFLLQNLFIFVTKRTVGFQRWRFYTHRAAIPVYLIMGFFAVVSLSRVDIGHRLILMIIPLECLVAGSMLNVLTGRMRSSWRNLFSGVFLALLLIPPLKSYPDYVSYFNPSIGARENAIHFLCDSNVDWGQNVKMLGEYLDKHHIKKVNLSLFGTSDPFYYGIHHWIDIGSWTILIPRWKSGPPDYTLPTAVSANMRDYIKRKYPYLLRSRKPLLFGGSMLLYPPALTVIRAPAK